MPALALLLLTVLGVIWSGDSHAAAGLPALSLSTGPDGEQTSIYDAAMAYKAPFISGKDSLNNEYTDENGER